MATDYFGCLGNTIITSSGNYFDYDDIENSQVYIFDIASSLANTCRFAGHCRFYSVAEHCCHCFDHASQEYGDRHPALLAILMHDAAEAYVGDLPKPLKNILPSFSVIENKIDAKIRRQYSIVNTWDWLVKELDRRALFTEKMHLFPMDKSDWGGFEGWNESKLLSCKIQNWEPRKACSEFLNRFTLITETR